MLRSAYVFGNLRSFTDRASIKFRSAAMTGPAPANLMVTTALGAGGGVQARHAAAGPSLEPSLTASAAVLQQQIDRLIRKRK